MIVRGFCLLLVPVIVLGALIAVAIFVAARLTQTIGEALELGADAFFSCVCWLGDFGVGLIKKSKAQPPRNAHG